MSDNKPITLINVFSVRPGKQQELLDHVSEFSERVAKKMPGFISATFHASFDGSRVVNVAQWESTEAFYAFLDSPGGRADRGQYGHMTQRIEYNLYTAAAQIEPTKE
ncbi:heme-degrading monooxygenase HmoA [Thermosporothrix hazakensis]|jgi:heme-degrading monooxygenase HmoA|uniref:Heme-degrading monooxygenase HmoA n=1 Tax=Thermosporothrix hazakensis TaxID=644383 RepID=A0A326TQR6_THEHA|nr:antibiotic biosynthesis monooxygenase family protein [Thermosporothrix hazakensis]PZW18308.1 heme-degrading monooxygenase HmoA [Thermosporothrix hazakensis]GCE51434.1 antibiotic biosynthesis monooxygenase [Thermosporothrix hazakensis]